MQDPVELRAAGVDRYVRKSVLHQDTRAVVSAHTSGAEDHIFGCGIQLAIAGAEIAQRDADSAGNLKSDDFGFFSDIEDHSVLRYLIVADLNDSVQNIFGCEARHIDRVLRRVERRRVSQFEVLKSHNSGAETDGGSDRVDALVHAVLTYDLGSVYFGAVSREEELDEDRDSSGIVARMGVLRDDNALVVLVTHHSASDESLFICSRGSCRHVKNLSDGRPLRALVGGRDTADVVGDNARLLVGGACQRDHCAVPEDEILHFDDVAGRVDIGIGGLHVIIYDDAAAGVELEAGLLRDLAVGTHTDGEDDDVSVKNCAAIELYVDRRALVLKGGDAVRKMQAHAVASDIVMQDFGHLGIHGRHDLVCRFDDGDAKACVMKVFRHFQADEAASDDDSALCALLADHTADVVGVRNGPKGQNTGRVNARYAGAKRR